MHCVGIFFLMIEWLTLEWGLGIGAIVRVSGRDQATLGDSSVCGNGL